MKVAATTLAAVAFAAAIVPSNAAGASIISNDTFEGPNDSRALRKSLSSQTFSNGDNALASKVGSAFHSDFVVGCIGTVSSYDLKTSVLNGTTMKSFVTVNGNQADNNLQVFNSSDYIEDAALVTWKQVNLASPLEVQAGDALRFAHTSGNPNHTYRSGVTKALGDALVRFSVNCAEGQLPQSNADMRNEIKMGSSFQSEFKAGCDGMFSAFVLKTSIWSDGNNSGIKTFVTLNGGDPVGNGKLITASDFVDASAVSWKVVVLDDPIEVAKGDVMKISHSSLDPEHQYAGGITKQGEYAKVKFTIACVATPAPSSSAPTLAPITSSPSTTVPTTSPTVSSQNRSALRTSAPITASPTTAALITTSPITAAPTTSAPSTAAPSTTAPSTSAPSTAAPITSTPSTAPVTPAPTNEPSASPTTEAYHKAQQCRARYTDSQCRSRGYRNRNLQQVDTRFLMEEHSNCTNVEYDMFLVIEGVHFAGLATPKSSDVACPSVVFHSAKGRDETVVKQSMIADPEEVATFDTDAKHHLGSRPLGSIISAYDAAPVGKDGAKFYDAITNNCVSLLRNMADPLDVDINDALVGFVSRKLLSTTDGHLFEGIRNSPYLNMLYEGGRRMLKGMSEEDLIKKLITLYI